MRERQVELLIAYLQALCQANAAGVKVYNEMRRVIGEIEELLKESE